MAISTIHSFDVMRCVLKMAPWDSGIGGWRRKKSGEVERRALCKEERSVARHVGPAGAKGGMARMEAVSSMRTGDETVACSTAKTHAWPDTSKPAIFAFSGMGPLNE